MKISDIKPLDIVKFSLAFAVLYNMVAIPIAAACGIILPPIVIEEAMKLIMMLGGVSG